MSELFKPWVEKYRPGKIQDCILPEHIKSQFQAYVDSGNIPNLLLVGGPGIGKTSAAIAMLKELGVDYYFKNGSLERNIDILRNDIVQYASTVSMDGRRKYVVIDEADYLNPTSTQPAFRGFLEEYATNCGFIFTANFENKLIPPLHSRFSRVEFKVEQSDKNLLCANFFKRVMSILKTEGIKLQSEDEKKDIAKLISDTFPDWRKVLNTLQGAYSTGKLNRKLLQSEHSEYVPKLWNNIAVKNFSNVQKIVFEEIVDLDVSKLLREMYAVSDQWVMKESKADLVRIIAKYQYQSAFSIDNEITFLGAIAEFIHYLKFWDPKENKGRS